jgi:hypothetical protein
MSNVGINLQQYANDPIKPWEMTYKQWLKAARELFGKCWLVAFEIGGTDGHGVVGEHHRKLICKALKEGLTVPPEVLKDYPDLQSK